MDADVGLLRGGEQVIELGGEDSGTANLSPQRGLIDHRDQLQGRVVAVEDELPTHPQVNGTLHVVIGEVGAMRPELTPWRTGGNAAAPWAASRPTRRSGLEVRDSRLGRVKPLSRVQLAHPRRNPTGVGPPAGELAVHVSDGYTAPHPDYPGDPDALVQPVLFHDVYAVLDPDGGCADHHNGSVGAVIDDDTNDGLWLMPCAHVSRMSPRNPVADRVMRAAGTVPWPTRGTVVWLAHSLDGHTHPDATDRQLTRVRTAIAKARSTLQEPVTN